MSPADATRQRLVRAALELFTAQGYHATTTPQIARKAGVAEGTIYRHFTSKQHLLNELYRGAARWASKLVAEADATGATPREKLGELGRNLVGGAARDPAVTRLFFLDRHGALLDEESRKTARDFRVALEVVVAQGKAAGTVKAGAAELWAAVWLSITTFAVERVTTREWASDHGAIALVLDAAWDAIRAGG
ncbi:MAG TPA: TetR/AcrR family transcriptional regulator [Gemmatimonadales bacterium]|nr:TetR/AcrR family transcriptional regulator [Gemmatimonadales bacterium]